MADNRVVVYAGPGQVAIENTEFPKLEIPREVAQGLGIKQAAPHAVILKLVTTNICGSDQHMVRGRTTAPVGQSLGHEITGEIVEIGDDGVATFSVEFTKSGKTVACRADENVLDAALAAGVRLASSCSQGVCGTCKIPKLSGEVEMNHNGGIRPREVTAGKILACCSKPLSDLSLDA